MYLAGAISCRQRRLVIRVLPAPPMVLGSLPHRADHSPIVESSGNTHKQTVGLGLDNATGKYKLKIHTCIFYPIRNIRIREKDIIAPFRCSLAHFINGARMDFKAENFLKFEI